MAERRLTKEQLRRRREHRRRRRRILMFKRAFALSVVGILALGVIVLGIKVVKVIVVDKDKKVSIEQETNQSGSGLAKSETVEGEVTPKENNGLETVNAESLKPKEVEDIKITISAAGDCTLGTDENFDANSSFQAKYEEVGYPAYFFENVKEIFDQDDLTIVNLEGTFTTSTDRQDKQFAFKGDPSYTQILTEGSVEAVNLANNHSKDYGMESLEDTKKYVTQAGITSFGYEETAVVEIKGVKVGLVGIYVLADGIERLQQVKDNIAQVKSEGAILTIVSFHWGTEKENYPDEVQKQLAHTAIDAGADLVLGHHPHVLQGIETYNGKNIVYSLGNFCFGGNKNPSDKDTMIFQQTFTIQAGQVEVDDNTNIIPCSISSTSDYNDYRPTILTGERAEEVLQKVQTFSSGLGSE